MLFASLKAMVRRKKRIKTVHLAGAVGETPSSCRRYGPFHGNPTE